MEDSIIPKGLKIKDKSKLPYIDKTSIKAMMYTPENTVEDMLDLLPKEVWSNPDIKFLDMVCKSGVFLEKIYWRLEEGLRKVIPNIFERNHHIMKNQIYALVPLKELLFNSRTVLYGTYKANHSNAFTRAFDDEDGNIKLLEWRDKSGKKYDYIDIIREETGGMLRDFLKGAFGNMRFDVVVGNPPYNRGMDLDFVHRAFELSKRYVVMITPAKWQTAADDYRGCASKTIDYKGFREKLVPHMSKVVFFPCCKDVFDIKQVDGISYYVLDKWNIHKECEVENRSSHFNMLNTTRYRDIKDRQSLLNAGNDVIEVMGEYKRLGFEDINIKHKYCVECTEMGPGALDWNKIERPTYITSLKIVSEIKEFKSKDHRIMIFTSDSESECRSFISYIETRLNRFLYFSNISKLTTIYTEDCFRFVPAPPSGKFDHIYTDEELYKAFNLPQKYIDVIGAVIKERE